MGREWECICKDCNAQFTYSDTKYQAGLVRGHSRPERCDNCRAHHSRELQSIGQPYYVVKAIKPIGDPRRLNSDLGRFNREDRPHKAVDTIPPSIDPNKFGIKNDRLVEMFHFFKQDPGLQVVVVVGPTGSGKSTYLPYRLVELPEDYQNEQGVKQDSYWTVPIETDGDLESAQAWVKEQARLKGTGEHTIYVKGHNRHYASKPSDSRAIEHKVSGAGGLDPKMFWRYGQIVITQPRIQATRNIPDFIAKAMMGCKLGAGHDVGFRHSGSPNSDWSTKLAFVTDGTLITWIAKGELDKINTIMIDEAHERTLNIDIIIGMLTQLLPRYPRLRLIIASATIAADKFINHFNKYLPQRRDKDGNILPNCRYMEFEGKSFKVSPHFRNADETPLEYYREKLPPGPNGQSRWEGRHRSHGDLSKLVAEKAIEILKAMYDPSPDGGYIIDHSGQKIDITERQGDVLGFLHGEKPIEDCCATVEKLAQSELGGHIKIKALPLYTTLAQNRQDEALKEREQPHGTLLKRIVKHLEEVATAQRPFGDVLAISNNAGQIHNLCEDLKKKIASEKSLTSLVGRVAFVPWFTPETAKQLFEIEGDPRREMTIPPITSGVMRVVISTTRHRKLLPGQFSTVIEVKPEEQRVVVSTNVAETSLTIHGILHVVDSGLINQNKWDAATQTSGVSPILQSRAGCKQRWGRAGRLQAGDAWLLYTAEQFGNEQGENDDNLARVFDFYSRPEIARSPLEQVLLTAKKSGVESLDPAHFPWLDAPDSDELARSDRSLRQKGALDPDGDLTAHGVELAGMIGVDARVGNMLVVADRFSCAVEMATVVAVATAERKGLKALLEFDKEWDDQSLQEVRRRQAVVLSGCKDDLDAALRLSACWEEVLAAGRAFVGMVQLILNGDELTKERGTVVRNSQADNLLLELISAKDELVLEETLNQLSNIHPNPKDRIPDLRKAAETSLTIRKTFSRLDGVWQAVTHEWSFNTVWNEAVASQILGRGGSNNLKHFMIQITDPDFASNPRRVAHAVDQLQQSDRKSAEDALVRLPETGARAWARANYLVPDALAGVITSRAELLEPLEAHKKGSEWRPLDLARNNRLRAIFAHCLPENAFIKTNGARYSPAAAGVPLADLDVEPAADSVCATLPPDLFVCVERRAGPAIEGKARKLFASFLVALPTSWASILSDTQQPFHKLSATRLGKFVAEQCPPQPHFGKDLLLDSVYPRSSHCHVQVVKQLDENKWEVVVEPPHSRPKPVVLRPKRAGESDVVDQETEVAIRIPRAGKDDFGLTRQQRSIKANIAVEDWDKGGVSAAQWESLYRSDNLHSNDGIITPQQTLVIAEQVIRPHVSPDSAPGVLIAQGSVIQPNQKVLGEVIQIITSENGERRLMLSFISPEGSPVPPPKPLGATNDGKKYTFSNLRVEILPLDGGTLLIAREINSGVDVTFGPKDLSYSWCGLVPEKVFHALGGEKGTFQAKLVQFDEESGRVRMTTHHVFDELFPDPKVFTGQQHSVIVQNVSVGTFVSLERGADALKKGLMVVARIPEGQIQGERDGTRHSIYASYPSRTTESWPENAPVPKDQQFNDSLPGKLIFRGTVAQEQIDRWLEEVRGRRDSRAAIYSLYERSRQLNAMDEAEYRRWSASIDKEVKGRVERISDAGLQMSLADSFGVRAWLPRVEYTWYCDEDHTQLNVGEEITVKGLEIDWEKNQVILSRRKITNNPYSEIEEGKEVDCQVITTRNHGVTLSIKRLRGWAFNNGLAWLPQETNQAAFTAKVTKTDIYKGEIQVSRWPIVQEQLRKIAKNVVLKGKVIGVKKTDAEVELALGLVATLWAGEVTNQQGRIGESMLLGLIGSEIEVVILPKQEKDWDNRIRVSRKQAWSGSFQLTGAVGNFFGTGWTHVKAIVADVTNRIGFCRVDAEKEKPGAYLLISGDTNAAYSALVARLQAHAGSTRCSLIQYDSPRAGPEWLANLRLLSRPSTASYVDTTVRPKPPIVVPTHQGSEEKPKKKGILSWILRLFTGK